MTIHATIFRLFTLISITLTLSGCSSRSNSVKFEKNPVDELIRDLSGVDNFSIILYDMDAKDDTYLHQYNVITEMPDTVLYEKTEWKVVPAQFFQANIDNMGMEIVSKKDGKLSKQASPAGYNHYVGNERYGQWRQHRDGYSFWEFYGRYAFMSSLFNMMTYPARRSYYHDYHRGGYYGSRPYYGPQGSKVYGTASYTKGKTGSNTKWGKQPSSFKESVRNKVSRSSSTQSSSRTSRSSSRYNSSSSRSRSRSYGK